ncbi:MAG: GNAT family N-acetyltransferase [Alphaproteobacteria bacterium]
MLPCPDDSLVIQPCPDLSNQDIQQLLVAEKECFADYWQEADFKRFAGQDNLYVARMLSDDRSAITAYMLWQSARIEADLWRIAVLPHCRGIGLGKKLLKKALLAMQQQQLSELFLEVAVNNPVAIGLYQSVGAEVVGKRLHYYRPTPSQAIDALIMKIDLTRPL